MPTNLVTRKVARILFAGGVVSYPTEGVYGLGCLPDDPSAVARLLTIKGRSGSAGLILIAPALEYLEEWLAPTGPELERLLAPTTYPITWIVTAASDTPDYLTGGRNTVAVRISDHPVVKDLCIAASSALISTSANRSGRPAARSALMVHRQLGEELDFIVTGALGTASGPSEIRMAQDNRVLRSRHIALSD